MKTGVFGGTFNPIHNSHLYLAQQCLEKLSLDTVIFMPTSIPPHKNSDSLVSGEDRYNMCKLAIGDTDKFSVSRYEIDKQGKSYTYKTLEYLKMKMPDNSLYFLMGGDMFLTIENWKNPKRVYKAATICAIAREGEEYSRLVEKKRLLESRDSSINAVVLEIEPKPLSSTEIRERVAKGENIGEMVPKEVADYINNHRLYLL